MNFLYVVAMVRFMETSYTVREDSGQIEICVVIDGRVGFDFTVGLSTVDGTAGIYTFCAQGLVLQYICGTVRLLCFRNVAET